MAPAALPEKEGGAAASSPRRRGVRPAAGPARGREEGGICLLMSTQKYFPPFQNGAFHLLILNPLGKKRYLSHPADKGLGSDQGRLASHRH